MLLATWSVLSGTTESLTTGLAVLASLSTTRMSSPSLNSMVWPISRLTNQAESGVPEYIAEKSGSAESLVRPTAAHEDHRWRLQWTEIKTGFVYSTHVYTYTCRGRRP